LQLKPKALFIRFFILIITFVITAACSEPSSNQCITVDTLKELYSSDRYSVYQRISGFQDKSRIIEVYQGQPRFDRCAMPITPPVFEDSIETEGNIQSITYLINDRSIQVEYSDKAVHTPTVIMKDSQDESSKPPSPAHH
jgi:hypothetical protein